MNGQELFEIWAPSHGVWTPWARATLFATLGNVTPGDTDEVSAFDAHWAPSTRESTAILIDLPGAQGVEAAMALAERGYRPVPLFDGHAGPAGFMAATGEGEPTPALASIRGKVPISVIDVRPIRDALCDCAGRLAVLDLPLDAPPAFLLDASRLRGAAGLLGGRFDNRWFIEAADLPSGIRLLSWNIHRVLLLQLESGPPQADLMEVFFRWKHAGIRIEIKATTHDGPAVAMEFPANLPDRRKTLPGDLIHHPQGGYGGQRPAAQTGAR